MAHMANVTQFPRRSSEATSGATRLELWRGRARETLGKLFNRLGAPGAIRPVSINDSLTGQRIQVQVGPLLTRLSVNGRDYYFDRITGRAAGTGSGCV